MSDGASTRRAEPWRFGEMLILYVCTALGFATILVAWWAVSGTTEQVHQVPWVNVGVIGLMVLGTGNCFWLLAGRRAVGERRRALLEGIAVRALAAPELASVGDRRNGAGPKPVWVEGMAHYHRPTCQLVRGKVVVSASPTTHHRRGRRPCGMCEP